MYAEALAPIDPAPRRDTAHDVAVVNPLWRIKVGRFATLLGAFSKYSKTSGKCPILHRILHAEAGNEKKEGSAYHLNWVSIFQRKRPTRGMEWPNASHVQPAHDRTMDGWMDFFLTV